MKRSKRASLAAVVLCVPIGIAWANTHTRGEQDLQRYQWRVNTFTYGAQHQAALTLDRDGQPFMVWSSRRQQSGRAGVYGQRFDADGVAVGGELSIGLWPYTHQTRPAVTTDGSGNIWTVWEAHGQDGHAGSIIARRFDTQYRGGSEIIVNQQWRGHQGEPVIAGHPTGGAVVAWVSRPVRAAPQRVCARLLRADGEPAADEFFVSAAEGRDEFTPAVAWATDGFAVVYSVFDKDMSPAGIRMQLFDSDGRHRGTEVVVSEPPRRGAIEPVIAGGRDGYVVAWLDSESDGDDYGVLARRFDVHGRPRGAAFVVNCTTPGPQTGAAVAIAADGRFAVAWNSANEDGSAVFVQLFSADGHRLGAEQRLTPPRRGSQRLASATGTQRLLFTPRGELLCVWSGDGSDDDETGVYSTLLTPRQINLAGRVQGVTPGMHPAGPVLVAADGPVPHIPPTFDPLEIETGERVISTERGLGFDAVLNTGWTPPDPHLAAGPNHLVAIVNGQIAFFTKQGAKTFQQPIEGAAGFWGSVGASDFVFDPEVLYDELSGRFFAMATEGYAPPNQSRSYVLVAVSDDADPHGTWYKYRFNTTAEAGNMFDSPNIGVDGNVVYITGDAFGAGAKYPVYTFDKASLLAGNPPAIQRKVIMPTSTLSAGLPAVTYGNPPALYLLEHGENPAGSNDVRVIALRDPLGSPYFTDYRVPVATYRPPEDAPQKGTSTRLETFDARFWSVAYHHGSLWAVHHVNNTRVRARWYQIALNGWPTSGQNPSLLQWGEIDLGSDIRTFFPAIGVNRFGDAVITAARSSPNEYTSMIVTYRYVGDPANKFRTPVIVAASSGLHTGDRWGDYAGVVADPLADNVLWAHHEYAIGNSWRTWIAQVWLPRGDLNCDGAVNLGDINAFVLALTNPAGYQTGYPNCDLLNADINADGLVNLNDVNPFVRMLTAP